MDTKFQKQTYILTLLYQHWIRDFNDASDIRSVIQTYMSQRFNLDSRFEQLSRGRRRRRNLKMFHQPRFQHLSAFEQKTIMLTSSVNKHVSIFFSYCSRVEERGVVSRCQPARRKMYGCHHFLRLGIHQSIKKAGRSSKFSCTFCQLLFSMNIFITALNCRRFFFLLRNKLFHTD